MSRTRYLPLNFAFTLALVAAVLPRPAEALNYSWISGVSGSAGDPNRWTPFGVPGNFDHARFTVTGTYTVTMPSTVPGTTLIDHEAGTVTLALAANHSTGGINLDPPLGGFATMRVTQAVAGTNYVMEHGGILIGSAGSTSFNVMAGTWLHGINGGIDYVGWSTGSALVNLTTGSRMTSNRLQIAEGIGGSGTVSVAGVTSTLPLVYTGLEITDAAHSALVGADGTGLLSAFAGGWVDAAGDVVVGHTSTANGTITIGPASGSDTSWMIARKGLYVGNNEPSAGGAAGHGELNVRDRAWVNVAGGCQVGDPHNDTASFLRVYQGGSLALMGGLKVWPGTGAGLDLRGGTTQIRGGQFSWPANKLWTFSSTVGFPTLTIANGQTNVGPSVGSPSTVGLHLGRGGAAILKVIGANTRLPIGGAVTMSDSLSGAGQLELDTLAVVDIDGSLAIGNRANASVTVRRGADLRARTVSIGLTATSNNTNVLLEGLYQNTPTRFHAIDNAWIGGSSLGPGGTTTLDVREGSGMIVSPSGVSPSIATIYPTATVYLREDGFLKAGIVQVQGTLYMTRDASVLADLAVIHSTGYVSGKGWFDLATTNNGFIDVYDGSIADECAAMGFGGSYTQNATGTYRCNAGFFNGSDTSDTLVVLGTATLGGTLKLFTTPGTEPQPGDTLTIVTCAARSGTFQNVLWNDGPIGGHAEVLYGPTWVKVAIPYPVGVPLPEAPHALRFVASRGAQGPEFLLDLPEGADVDVKLYDVTGRRRAVLAHGALPAGTHRIAVPASQAAGVVFARAVVRSGGGEAVRTARIVLP